MAQIAQFDVWIPNDTAEAREVQERIVGLMEQNAWPMRECFGVRLALEEALVNAIKHGNQMDPTKTVRIACQIGQQRVRIEIEDQGTGFHPEDLPDPTADENLERPCGRGIMLMRAFMTSITFNPTGNCVVMTKDRSEPEPETPAGESA